MIFSVDLNEEGDTGGNSWNKLPESAVVAVDSLAHSRHSMHDRMQATHRGAWCLAAAVVPHRAQPPEDVVTSCR